MAAIRIVDVTDDASYSLLPPCADPTFDHRSCDYWEDAERGSRRIRLAWLEPAPAAEAPPAGRGGTPANPFLAELAAREPPANPFAPDPSSRPAFNPFAPGDAGPANPFAPGDAGPANPFAPRRPASPSVAPDAPPKLRLLARGLAVFGSYAKVLLLDERPAGYAQFGPLSAYPRAQRVRELYPQLPDAPLPAVITCIATTAEARGRRLAHRLVDAVCDDLAERGFAAVEAYPEAGAPADATSAAAAGFWLDCGFALAVDDARYPVVRRELA